MSPNAGFYQMPNQRVTIDEALGRAFWTVKVPSMGILLGTLLGTYLAMKAGWLPSRGLQGMRWFGPLFLLAFIGSWLVWSVQVPKWRLWAYERVEDIQELKSAAIADQLIWPDDSVFTRSELASRATWARIRKIEAGDSHKALDGEAPLSGKRAD